jgi:hypothetical protein
MEGNKGGKKKSFEDALFNALNAHGLLFPVTDVKVSEYEKELGNTEKQLPNELENPLSFEVNRGKLISLKPSNEEVEQPIQYAKVALKIGGKKNKKKS